MAHRWYVMHVYSGFEKKAKQAILEKAAKQGLLDKFEEILVPTEEVVEVRRGSKVNAERKFFPGYVLIKMDMTDESWHLVRNTPKVIGGLTERCFPVSRGCHRGRRGYNAAPSPTGGFSPTEARL